MPGVLEAKQAMMQAYDSKYKAAVLAACAGIACNNDTHVQRTYTAAEITTKSGTTQLHQQVVTSSSKGTSAAAIAAAANAQVQ